MTEATPLKPTRREMLSALTGELRETQRALKSLKTEKCQIWLRRIRNEKALEKLEKQIKEQESRLENARNEPEKQENARQVLEHLQTNKQQLLDEQGKNAGKPDELDIRIQEMEQKKTTAQKMIAELENNLTRQLFSAALPRLSFFFLAMGIFLILVGLAGVNLHGSINLELDLGQQELADNLVSSINDIPNICEDISACSGLICNLFNVNDKFGETCKTMLNSTLGQIDLDEWKKEMHRAMNQAETKIEQLLQSVSEFLIVIGLVMFIIFGACWVGLERRRMLNLPVTAED